MPRTTGPGLAAVALTVVVLGPLLAAIAARAGRAYLPIQDLAVADARVRDTWSTNIPLVGPWSRFGWSHPGPMYFWLLAVPYRIAGDRTWSLIVGGALLQAVAVVGCVALAWRRGRLGLVVVVTTMLGLAFAWRGAIAVIVPWNPYVAFPFFPLFLLLAWSVAVGDVVLAPWLVVVATFLVQTHVGYLPLVAVVTVATALLVVRDRRWSRELRPRLTRPLAWSAVAGVLLWTPVAVEQLWGGHNLTRLVRYFSSSKERSIGLRRGMGLLAAEFRVPPPWLGGHDSKNAFSAGVRPARLAWLLLPMVLLVVAAVVTRRHGSSATRRLVVLSAALFATAIPALAGVRGNPLDYLFEWRVFVALFVVAAVMGALWPWLLRQHHTPVWGVGALVLVIVTLTVSGRLAYDTATYGTLSATEGVARRMEPALLHAAPRGTPILVRGLGPNSLGLQLTLIDALERRGIKVRVDPSLGYLFGDRRTARPSQVRSVWYVTEDGWVGTVVAGTAGAMVLARFPVLPPAEERELETLQRALHQELVAAHRTDLVPYLGSPLIGFALGRVPGIDLTALDRAGHLNGAGLRSGPCRCLVVAFDPSSVPRSIPLA